MLSGSDEVELDYYAQTLNLRAHQVACRQNFYLPASQRITSAKSGSRETRALSFSYPGTNWCGSGNTGTNLEMSARADQCCQYHDNCLYHIGAMESAYGLFNWRLYTVSYCQCDNS